ncbi:hypothetical protein B296_00058210 [Ensete ventricosum]|uniref:Uncharacterized protein n=1 Tax=Ensete ventricosum TaxID=4639 RepID=A0A426X5M8_ENSVE|nr:hypothetical protein B296_00058210 [Ensete ventricosum]
MRLRLKFLEEETRAAVEEVAAAAMAATAEEARCRHCTGGAMAVREYGSGWTTTEGREE